MWTATYSSVNCHTTWAGARLLRHRQDQLLTPPPPPAKILIKLQNEFNSCSSLPGLCSEGGLIGRMSVEFLPSFPGPPHDHTGPTGGVPEPSKHGGEFCEGGQQIVEVISGLRAACITFTLKAESWLYWRTHTPSRYSGWQCVNKHTAAELALGKPAAVAAP